MNRNPTPHDLQAISDYLDGRLPAKELVRLQARLREEPALRAELQSLQQTRIMLRSLPRRRAPRNFTLSRAVARARPVFQFFPGLRLASALSAFLLMLAFAGDLLFGRSSGSFLPVVFNQPQQTAPAIAAAPFNPAATAAPESALEPTKVLLSSPGAQPNLNDIGRGGGAGGGAPDNPPPANSQPKIMNSYPAAVTDESTATETATPTVQPSPTRPAPSPLPSATPETAAAIMGLQSLTPTLTPTETATTIETLTPTATLTETATPTSTPTPTPDTGPTETATAAQLSQLAATASSNEQAAIQPTEMTQDTLDRASSPGGITPGQHSGRLLVLRLMEIFLAFVSVGCGTAAFYFYRRDHP